MGLNHGDATSREVSPTGVKKDVAEDGGRAQERSLGGRGGPQPAAARQWDLSSARWCQQPKEAWKGSSQSLDKSSTQPADTLVSLTGLSGVTSRVNSLPPILVSELALGEHPHPDSFFPLCQAPPRGRESSRKPDRGAWASRTRQVQVPSDAKRGSSPLMDRLAGFASSTRHWAP